MRCKRDKECIENFGQFFRISDSNWEYQELLDEITPSRALTSFHHLAGFEFFSVSIEHLLYFSRTILFLTKPCCANIYRYLNFSHYSRRLFGVLQQPTLLMTVADPGWHKSYPVVISVSVSSRMLFVHSKSLECLLGS